MAERLTDQWHECQRRVSALERQYADAMAAYYRGEGPPPPEAMHRELSTLREEAKRLLTAALADIDRRMHDQGRKLRDY